VVLKKGSLVVPFIISAVVWVVLILILALAVSVKSAHAQSGNFVWSERSSSAPYGIVYPMWNATGSTIADGTIVMTDTTGTTVQPQISFGKGFKTFSGATTDVRRIVGVLLGDCPGYSYGRVMVMGFHNHLVMAATGVAANTNLEPGLTAATAGQFSAWVIGDTLNTAKPVVARFQRYTTTTALYGWGFVNFLGSLGGK
jgi:hypothetical protein